MTKLTEINTDTISEDFETRYEKLKELMDQLGQQPLCLAFSGGVDSSLLLRMAAESGKRHGNPVYAVTFNTMLHPACDLEIAERVAKELETEHIVFQIDELELEEMRSNPPERCYLCKKQLFEKLIQFAKEKQIGCIIDGTNEDDLHVYRPGIRALRELGVISPLAQCHITKKEVKELAAGFGLSVASRPSTPCMATRLPYGAHLDYELLQRIEEGEDFLRECLPGNVRLRIHGDTARIELDASQLEKALANRGRICEKLKELGFTYITLDLEGFRSGSMDVHINSENKNS